MNTKRHFTERPKILAIIESPSQQVYFQYDQNNFDWQFYLFDPAKTYSDQMDEILTIWYSSRNSPQGVLGITDEPSLLAALLAQRLGLPGNNPTTIYRIQHKALFTTFMSQYSPYVPETYIINSPSDIPQHMTYPAFLRPVKGSLSMHAYRINSPDDLAILLPEVFAQQRPLLSWTEQFEQEFAGKTDPSIRSFLMQPYLDYPQFTVDGYVYGNDISVLGITSSVYTSDRTSFARFDYPSEIAPSVKKELIALLNELLPNLGYKNSGFNMEFFITHDNHIIVIELNTRLSVQFVPLMREQYNHTNIYAMARISMGLKPDMKIIHPMKYASSCVLRTNTDKYVYAVPPEAQIQTLITQGYITNIRILVTPGSRLSDYEQDSYSYRYALLDIAGNTPREIHEKLEYATRILSFDLRE